MALQAKTLVRITGILIFLWLSAVNVAMAQEGVGDSGSTGSFNINEEPVDIRTGGTYTITGSEQTDKTITVNLESKEAIANITIKNVKIGLKGCPFNIIQGVVKLTLEGDNVLKAQGTVSDNTEAWCAALQVSEDSELVITKESSGKLTAIGGYGGAGIGGGHRSFVGSITIAGGTVEATGGYGGAGIGGDVINKISSITIAGGTVVATGGENGAGIGGGSGSTGVSITISGGKVTTEGNIGDGGGGSGANGTISGGTIVCKSISPTFTISGGSVHTSDKTIMSDNKRMAVVKGLPKEEKVTSIKIGEVTYNWKDVYTDENGMLYLYLKQEQPGSATVTIDTQTYTANALREYNVFNETVEIKAAGDYIITGNSKVTANTITVQLPQTNDVANITIKGVKIAMGESRCPFNIIQGVVNLTLEDDDNELQAGDLCAALQVPWSSELVITKESTGKLTATGGRNGAGIGGLSAYPVGSITIAGGTVVAKGGQAGAGIGGGIDGDVSSITIAGGTVEATGGDRGAGIGGGSGSIGGFITISGGKVTTEGNIGDGERGSGAKGTISGGTIVCKSISPTLSISGGSVRTKDNSFVDNKGMAVVKGLPKGEKVTSITINEAPYGSNDVYTDDKGQLYLYITKDKAVPVSIMVGGQEHTTYALTSLVVETKGGDYNESIDRLTITKAGEYTLKGLFALIPDKEKEGKKVSEYAIDYSIVVADNIQDKVTLHLDGVSLKIEANNMPALSCGSGNNVTVVLDGDNYLEGNDDAGINKGPDDGTLTIEGPGRLEAKGGYYGAGIGGNSGQQAKNITIAGGTIVATGGDNAPAGIGCGYNAGAFTATNISITGGSVNATVEGITDKKQITVTFPAMPGDKVIQVQGLDGYMLLGMNLYPKGTPSTATLYLWLPSNFNKEITINGYSATVTAGNPATLKAITISDPVTYKESLHKNKSITITSKGTFTINTDNASVIDLTIEPGGKLLTTQQLEVKGEFTVEPNTILDKWITFCSPVPLKLFNQSWAAVSDPLGGPSLKSGFTTATDQEWTFEQSIKEDTPYLIKVPTGIVNPVLYAQNVTLLENKDISINPPSGFDNNLLFCANMSLTEQTLTNIYVLDKYNERQAVLLKSNYTLKPFEAYFIASPASPTTPAIESQGEPGKVTSPELRVAPDDIIMPQKLTLKQPNSGKGSFTVTEDKNGQVAYGFALKDAKVTLELRPNVTDGYSIDKSLIKVYETNDPNKAITLNGTESPFTFTMPNAPVTIEVEFMKTLTIKPDEGQVVYADEEIKNYHPTYTVEGITEADGNVVFTGNLKVDGNKIVNDNLSAGVAYKIEVKEGVTVERLSGNASDVVNKPLKLREQVNGDNGWYKGLTSVTLVAPRGFSIKQTSASPSPASLSLRDAAASDGYVNELTFSDEGEHTIHYSLKRIGMDNKIYEGNKITYKLDTEAPKFENVKTDIKMSVKLKLSDMVSGLASYSYKWDNNEEVKVSVNENKHEVFIILKGALGDHTLSIKVTDMAGNVFNDSNISLNIGKINEGGGNGGGSTPDIPDNEDDSGKDEPAPGPDEKPDDGGNPPVANEAIQAPAYGIYVENSKLCIETSQPCQVLIYNYQGSAVMIRQIPSGKTRLYELPVGQYIVCLSAPYLPQGKVTQKVRVN